MTLYLTAQTKIRVIRPGSYETELRTIHDLSGTEAEVYDFFGARHTISVGSVQNMQVQALKSMNGEMLPIGEESKLRVKPMRSGTTRDIGVNDIHDLHKVRLPNRKIHSFDSEIFDNYDADDTGIFITAPKATKLLAYLEEVSTRGITVRRHDTDLRIDIETKRPACFAAKLITGSFEADINEAIDSLVAGGVVQPHIEMGPDYVELAQRTKVLFEGTSTSMETLILPPIKTKRVLAVHPVTRTVAIETVWFHI